MTVELTDEKVAQHNALYQRGWDLTRGQLHDAEGNLRQRPGWLARRRLRTAIGCFQEALQINPGNWSAMWALGKIYQRFGEHNTSLGWFARAHELNPTQPDVAREGGLAALDSGDAEVALRLCSAAVSNDPNDPGLVANVALAHVLKGNDALALECAERALLMNPSDNVSVTVRDFVRDVSSGKRQRPRRLSDVFPQ
jgi:tetratricopeptide (TPR) repeat protein